jgi:hypothetical protein
MKTFIVYQMQIISEESIGTHNYVQMVTIVRKVFANSEEEAIGKFVLGTNEIEANKKLDIECVELSDLESL